MRQLIRRVWYAIQQRHLEADLAEEMEFHRAMTQHDLERGGVDVHTAATSARRKFGSAALTQDRARDVWIPTMLQDLSRDVRFAGRLLIRDRRLAPYHTCFRWSRRLRRRRDDPDRLRPGT
jgi:hypothetical protein